MKYIIIGDIHLDKTKKNKNDKTFEYQKLCLSQTVSKAKELSATIIQLGDIYDNREKSNNYNRQWFHEFVKNSNVNWIIIKGNHDLYFKNTRDYYSGYALQYLDNVKIVNDIEVIDNMAFVSWLLPEIDESKPLHNKIKDCDYVFGHFEFNGAMTNTKGVKYKNGLKQKDFKNYKTVYSGHFHSPHKIKNIQYVGSVMPFSFNELDVESGMFILDKKSNTEEFKKFEGIPKYVSFDINKDNYETDIDISEQDFVELRFLDNIGDTNILKVLENAQIKTCNPIKYKILYVIEEELTEKEKADKKTMLDIRSYANEYVEENIPESIVDQKTEIVEEIHKAMEEYNL